MPPFMLAEPVVVIRADTPPPNAVTANELGAALHHVEGLAIDRIAERERCPHGDDVAGARIRKPCVPDASLMQSWMPVAMAVRSLD